MLSILYVDDDPILRDLTPRFLERGGGVQVDVAPDVTSGLHQFSSRRYDAIVSDFEMPVRDGISFLQEIRASGNTIPFILFTGRGREDVAMAALNNGADFYLQKGSDSCQYTELLHMIRTAVDRYKAREEIAKAHQMMADIINHLPDPTFAVDMSGSVIAWNEAMEELSGVMAETMIGKGDYAYAIPFYGEKRPLILDYLLNPGDDINIYYKKPVKTDKGYTGSTTCTINEVERTFWVKASRFSDPDGNLSGAIESIRDTTQRVRLLHTLQNSRNHFENIIEHLPDPTFAIDKKGSVIAWNRAMVHFTGVTKTEIFGADDRAYARAIYGDKREILVDFLLNGSDPDPDRYKSVEKSPDSMSGYARIPYPNKSKDRIVWVVAGMLSDQVGLPYGSIVTFRDISHIVSLSDELKEKQEALESSYEELAVSQEELRESYDTLSEWKQLLEERELKYRTLVENSNDAVFMIQDSRYIYVNPTCSAISGYSEGDLYELDIWKTINTVDQPALRSHIQMVMNGIVRQSRYEALIQTRTGSLKMVEFAFDMIQYNGRPALLGRGRDITDRIRAEQSLIQANKKLHLLSSITRHDIKNHLTSLQAALAIMNETRSSDDEEVLLNIAKRSATSIDQAISFTALYQDIGISEPLWSDLEDSFSAYADIARSAGVEFSVSFEFMVEIYVDPLFSRVCYNLIENCVRHGGKVKRIMISAQMKGDLLVIHVADDGQGVADEEKEKIFLRGHGKNTGMGLFLVREILKITEIEIAEVGTFREGAVFEIIVPGGRFRPCSLPKHEVDSTLTGKTSSL